MTSSAAAKAADRYLLFYTLLTAHVNNSFWTHEELLEKKFLTKT